MHFLELLLYRLVLPTRELLLLRRLRPLRLDAVKRSTLVLSGARLALAPVRVTNVLCGKRKSCHMVYD